MAAPSGIIWGNIVTGSKSTRKGRIGIHVSTSATDTTVTVTVQTWFWSMYSVSDSNNSYYYNAGSTSASILIGSISINHTVNSGSGWSTSNQTKLGQTSYTYTKGTAASTKQYAAKLTGVDSVGGSNVMTASTSVTIPALTSYTVSYNANGGSGAPSAQTKWYGKNITLSTAKPTRTGYGFKGWATSSSGSVVYAPGASYTANAAVTLYAVWEANTYSVTYNANGGTGAPANQTKTYGVTLTLSTTIPTRTNYTFKGWGTTASTSTVAYEAGSNYTNNSGITLYAVWELSYVKPVISNLQVSRYKRNEEDTAYEEADDGKYARITFDWATTYSTPTLTVMWFTDSGEEEGQFSTSLSGSNGHVDSESIMGDYEFSPDISYTLMVKLEDSHGYSTATVIVPGSMFPIDVLYRGKGIALGKPAELEGICDIGFQTRLYGGIKHVLLKADTDLNDVRTPNTYIGENVSTYNYANCPVTSGTFTLLVEGMGESGQVRQTYSTCSKYRPEIFVRHFYQGSWGEWFWSSTDEVLLYENEAGSAGNVTLTYSASHFRYLEIFYTDNNGKTGGYTKVWKPDGKTVCLSLAEGAATMYYRQTLYTISGTSITPDATNASYLRMSSSSSASISMGTNYIKIVRVIGRA